MASPAEILHSSRPEHCYLSMSKGAVCEQSSRIQDGVKNQIFKRQIFQYQMLPWNSSWILGKTREHSRKCRRGIKTTPALSHREVNALCILADVDGNVQEDKIISCNPNPLCMAEKPSCCFSFTSPRATDLRPRSSAEGHLLTLQTWHQYESQGSVSCCQKPSRIRWFPPHQGMSRYHRYSISDWHLPDGSLSFSVSKYWYKQIFGVYSRLPNATSPLTHPCQLYTGNALQPFTESL